MNKPRIVFVYPGLHWGGVFGHLISLGNSLGDSARKAYVGWRGKVYNEALKVYQRRAGNSPVKYLGTKDSALISFVRSFRADIVVFAGPANIPSVLSPHLGVSYIYVAHTMDAWGYKAIDYGKDKIHTVIGVGKGIVAAYEKKYRKTNCVSILSSTDLRCSPKIGTGRNLTIGYFGNFEPRKKAVEIVRAFKRARKSGDRLLVAGGFAPYAAGYFKALKKEIKGAPGIELIVDVEDRAALFAKMDVHIVYSDWEGWPQTIVEAMRSGVPVLARKVCGPSVYHLEIPNDAIKYFDSLKEFGNVMRDLRNPYVRKTLAEQAFTFADKEHSVAAMTKRFVHVIGEAKSLKVNTKQKSGIPAAIKRKTQRRKESMLPKKKVLNRFKTKPKTQKSYEVAVLMVVYNTKSRFLEEAIASIEKQKGVIKQLVVADDGSTDPGTIEVLKKYERLSWVKIIWLKHEGIVAARNSALMGCNSKCIAVLDSDDVMVPDRLRFQVEYLLKHKEVSVLSGQMDYIDSKSNSTVGYGNVRRTSFKVDQSKFMWEQGWCIGHSTVCFRKDAVVRVGGYYSDQPNQEAQDFDLWCKLSLNGYTFALVDQVFCKYRMHSGQLTKTYQPTKALRDISKRFSRFYKYNYKDVKVLSSDAVFFNNGIGNFIQATPFIQNLNNPIIYIKYNDPRIPAIKSISKWPVKELSPTTKLAQDVSRVIALWCFSPKNLPKHNVTQIMQPMVNWKALGITETQAYLDIIPGTVKYPSTIKTRNANNIVKRDKRTIAVYNGCHPSWSHKLWPIEYMIKLTKIILQEHDVRFIYFGDKKEFAYGDRLCRTLGNRGINTAGKLTLDQTADALSMCDFAIGNDTGLMHVADAVGVPGVALFGSTLWSKCSPANGRILCIQSTGGGCKRFPCYGAKGKIGCDKASCMRAITPEQVYESIDFHQLWNDSTIIETKTPQTKINQPSIKVYLTTYNRPELAEKALRSIIREQGRGCSLQIEVIDDCSMLPYPEVINLVNKYSFVSYRKLSARNGRPGFWRIHDAILRSFKNSGAKYLSVIQDDVQLCDRIFEKALNLWQKVSHDKKAVALSMFRDVRFRTNPWRRKLAEEVVISDEVVVRHYWMDGQGWLAPATRLPKLLDHRIFPVASSRWNNKPYLSSGVFPQIADRMMNGNYYFYAPARSFIRHLTTQSQLNTGTGNELFVREENYIENEENCVFESEDIVGGVNFSLGAVCKYKEHTYKIFCATESDILYQRLSSSNKFYELDLLEKLKSYNKKGTYLDVGGNIGNHAVFFLNECFSDKVISIEAVPGVASILHHNLKTNNLFSKTFSVICAAAGLSTKHTPIRGIDDIDPNNVGGTKTLSTVGTFGVGYLRLDSLVKQDSVSIIKLDIEGHELAALKGARKIIKASQPIIVCECHTVKHKKEIDQFLKEWEYSAIGPYAHTPTYIWEPKISEQESKDNKNCPVCSFTGSFSSFGSVNRKDAQCPKCGSLERHRMLYLFLKRKTKLFKNKYKVLHFSPNAGIKKALSSFSKLEYITSNVVPGELRRVDITSIPKDLNSFDAIISVHLLEHINDDIQAMRELHRVLKIGSWAVIMVPILEEVTVEGISFKKSAEYFANPEHVRSYGLDIVDRLESVGFVVQVLKTSDIFRPNDVKKYGLMKDYIFFCHKK